MSVGDELRNARRSRGMTIERLGEVTKISAQVLRALEADDTTSLPRWVFVRGFLQSYARAVGLDPDKTIADYLAQHEPAVEPGAGAGARRSVRVENSREPIELEPSRDLGQMLTVAVMVIAVVAYLGLRNRAGVSDAASGSGASANATPPVAGAAPSATASDPGGRAPANVPAAAPADAATNPPIATAGLDRPQPTAVETAELTLELIATGECWIAAIVDGEPGVQRLMHAGDRQVITGRANVALRVGDPATLQLSINGMPARSLGEPARPVTLRLSPQNAREYVR